MAHSGERFAVERGCGGKWAVIDKAPSGDRVVVYCGDEAEAQNIAAALRKDAGGLYQSIFSQRRVT